MGCLLLPCCPQVFPEAGSVECGLGRRMDSALEALPPNAGGPTEQVRPGAGGGRGMVGLRTRGFASNKMKQTGAQAPSTVARGPDFRSTEAGSEGRASLGPHLPCRAVAAVLGPGSASPSLASVLRSCRRGCREPRPPVSRPAAHSRPITATPFWTWMP